MPGSAGERDEGVVGRPEFGSPGKNVVKQVVQQIKELAREYAVMRLGDPDFLRGIERAMARGSGDGREAAGGDGGEAEGGGVRGQSAVPGMTMPLSCSGADCGLSIAARQPSG